MKVKLMFHRQLMDVYLHQHISPDTNMEANSLAKILISNMLNGIPTKHDKVFSSFMFLFFDCNFDKDTMESCMCVLHYNKTSKIHPFIGCYKFCKTYNSLYCSNFVIHCISKNMTVTLMLHTINSTHIN